MEYFVLYSYVSFLIGFIGYYGLTFKVIKELEAEGELDENSDVLKYQSLFSVIMIISFSIISPIILIFLVFPKLYTEGYREKLLESE